MRKNFVRSEKCRDIVPLSSNRASKYPWKNISFLLVAPQKVLRVRTTGCLLFHQSKHVTAQGHFVYECNFIRGDVQDS